jgi:protein-tyrosine phosphatase
MEQIVPGIWLGDSRDAINTTALTSAGIRSVLNVAWDLAYNIEPSFIQTKVGLIDGPGNRIGAFALAVETLAKLATLGPVLVHCHAGKSRSPSVLSAFLVKHRNYRSFNQAIRECYSNRPSMDPQYDPKPALAELAEAYLRGENIQ